MVRVKSLRNVMEEAPQIFKALQGVVIEPSFSGALWLLLGAFAGEVIAPFPSGIFFASQLLFIDNGISFGFIVKLVFLFAIPLAFGGTVGSFLPYGIAYFGGKPAIEKFKKYLRFSWEDVEKFESRFKNNWYDELLFLGIRIVPFIPTTPVHILAGILRMSFWRYTILTFIGTVIRMMILVFIFASGGGIGLVNFIGL